MSKKEKTMGKIQLPPGTTFGGSEKTVFHVCVSSDGTDYLEVDIDQPGYCLHAPNGSFKAPDLPSGPVSPQPPLNLYPAVKAGKAYLAYGDSTSGKTFVFVIKIQEDPCKSDNGDS